MTIHWRKLYAVDATCWLCGEPTDPADFTRNPYRLRPGPHYPSVDHVIPKHRGGTDDPDNLRLAHLVCNMRKHVRLPGESSQPAVSSPRRGPRPTPPQPRSRELWAVTRAARKFARRDAALGATMADLKDAIRAAHAAGVGPVALAAASGLTRQTIYTTLKEQQ